VVKVGAVLNIIPSETSTQGVKVDTTPSTLDKLVSSSATTSQTSFSISNNNDQTSFETGSESTAAPKLNSADTGLGQSSKVFERKPKVVSEDLLLSDGIDKDNVDGNENNNTKQGKKITFC